MSEKELKDGRPPFTMIHDSVILDYGLPGMALAVYVVLCQHSRKDIGVVFPSIRRIAKLLKCTDNTAKKYLKVLVKKELVSISDNYVESGRQTANLYTLANPQTLTPPPPNFEPSPHQTFNPLKHSNNKKKKITTKNTNKKNHHIPTTI